MTNENSSERTNDVSGQAQPIGRVLDGLGVTVELEEGDLVAGALVLLSVVGPDGGASLHIRHSGLGWAERLGVLDLAHRLELQNAMGDGA